MLRVALLALAVVVGQRTQPQATLRLEVRIFDGGQEVTPETHVIVHRGGERTDPIAQVTPHSGRLEVTLPPGIYDVQAIQERNGRVVNIRWAERFVVMPYPDEAGQHLEVINFKSGFGALEIRSKQPAAVQDVELYAAGTRDKPVASRRDGPGYALFVVPAGQYDIVAQVSGRSVWHNDIDVPLDRTRLWFVPESPR